MSIWNEQPRGAQQYSRQNAVAGQPPYKFPKPSVRIVVDADPAQNDPEVSHLADDRIYVDSCCSGDTWIMSSSLLMTNIVSPETTTVEGVGCIGAESGVFLCPTARKNLIGHGRIHRWGFTMVSPPSDNPYLMDISGSIILRGEYHRSMPHFDLQALLQLANVIPSECEALFANATDALTTWHARLGHVGLEKLLNCFKLRTVKGMNLTRACLSDSVNKQSILKCNVCRIAKGKKKSLHHHPVEPHIVELGDMIVCDFHVFINCPSREGFQYSVNLTDVASRKTFIFLIIQKTQFLDCLKQFVREELTARGLRMKHFHSDNDSVFTSIEVIAFLDDMNCAHTCSPSDTPGLNGYAEAANKFLGTTTLSLLMHSGLGASFWADAYKVSALLKGILPTATVRGYMSPHEFITGERPDVSRLRTWGSRCWVPEVTSDKRKDFHPPGVEGRLIGYASLPMGYIVWVPSLSNTVVSIDVSFDESIPDRAREYFIDLEPKVVKTMPAAKAKDDFKYLIGKFFVDPDDGIAYKVTRIALTKDHYVVAYVKLMVNGRPGRTQRTPFHVADIEEMIRVSTEVSTPTIAYLEVSVVRSNAIDDTSHLEVSNDNVNIHVCPAEPDQLTAGAALRRTGTADSTANMKVCSSVGKEGIGLPDHESAIDASINYKETEEVEPPMADNQGPDVTIIILVYVDDILIFANTYQVLTHVYNMFESSLFIYLFYNFTIMLSTRSD